LESAIAAAARSSNDRTTVPRWCRNVSRITNGAPFPWSISLPKNTRRRPGRSPPWTLRTKWPSGFGNGWKRRSFTRKKKRPHSGPLDLTDHHYAPRLIRIDTRELWGEDPKIESPPTRDSLVRRQV